MTITRRTSSARIAAAWVTCLLGACSGGSITPTSAAAPPPAENQVTTSSATAGYAAVAVVSLESVGLPADTALSQVSVASGEAVGLTIRDGEIRFITPSDPGVDSAVTLRVALPGSVVIVPVTIQSERPTAAVAHIESDENGTLSPNASKARLTVTGLGANNALTGQPLSFSVEGAPPLDLLGSAGTIFVPLTGETIDLAKHWSLDPVTNTLRISAEAMASVLADVPSGEIEFDIGLTSKDMDFAVAWTMSAHKPTAVLNGQVVGLDGSPRLDAAGTLVAIRGMDNRTRMVAAVDANGSFSAPHLGAGTYQLVILDPTNPNFWTVTAPVYPNSTRVNSQLPYEPAASKGGSASLQERDQPAHAGASARRIAAISFGARTEQDGEAPPRPPDRSAYRERLLKATPATCETSNVAAGEATYQAVAGPGKRHDQLTALQHAIPQGTRRSTRLR